VTFTFSEHPSPVTRSTRFGAIRDPKILSAATKVFAEQARLRTSNVVRSLLCRTFVDWQWEVDMAMRGTMVATALAVILAAGTTHASNEAVPARIGEWVEFRSTTPITRAKGAWCSFDLREDAIKDEELMRILATDASGNATATQFTGPLVFRYTNTETGKFVDRDLSGNGWLFIHEDGSSTWILDQHFGAGVKQGVPSNLPQGVYVLTGPTILEVGPKVSFEKYTNFGTIENICDTLAP